MVKHYILALLSMKGDHFKWQCPMLSYMHLHAIEKVLRQDD